MQKNSNISKIVNKQTLLSLLVVILLLALYNNLKSYFSQKSELEIVKKNLGRIEKENKDVQKDLLLIQDPDHIEKLIRKKLGRQKEGENVYIIPIPTISQTTE